MDRLSVHYLERGGARRGPWACARAVAEGSHANQLSSAAAAASLRRRDSSRRVPLLSPPDAGPRARRVVAPPRRGVCAHYGGAAPPAAGRRPVPRQGLDPLPSSHPLSSVRRRAVAWLSTAVLAVG